MRFSDLKRIVRQTFNIPIATEFAIVYTDDENEMVTMADDFDIGDAFFHQTQNPVRAIVVPQGELQCSAQDARPPERKELMIQSYTRLELHWFAVCVRGVQCFSLLLHEGGQCFRST